MAVPVKVWRRIAWVLACVALLAWPRVPADSGLVTRGEFWHLVDRVGASLSWPTTSEGLLLAPGRRLVFDDMSLVALELAGSATGRQSGYVDVRFGDAETGRQRLVIVPSEPLSVALSVDGGGVWDELERLSVEGLQRTLTDRFTLAIELVAGELVVLWNGVSVLEHATTKTTLADAVVWADDTTLAHLGVTSAAGRELSDNFDDVARRAHRHTVTTRLAAAALVVLWVTAWLATRRTRTPAVTWLDASTRLLAPLGALAVLAAVVPITNALTALLVVALIAVFSPSAWSRLREKNVGSRSAAILTSGLLFVALAALMAGAARTAHEAHDAAERHWRPHVVPTPFTHDAALTLDASNALATDLMHRDVTVELRARFAPDSLVEVRVRAPLDEPVAGVALCAGTIDALGTTISRLSSHELVDLAATDTTLPADTWGTLRLATRGEEFEASWNGQVLVTARADARCSPAGTTFVLAAAGTVDIESLVVTPTPLGTDTEAHRDPRLAGAFTLVALVLLLGLLSRVTLGQRFSSACMALVPAVAPIAFALAQVDDAGRLAPITATLALGATGLLLAAHGVSWLDPVRPPRRHIAEWTLVLLGTLASTAALTSLVTPTSTEPAVRTVTPYTFPGERLVPGTMAFRHPAIRRYRDELRDHRFRGRRHALSPAPGVVRVMALGSSSTWGHGVPAGSGLDYPTLVERLWNDAHAEQPIEVINGAIRGSSAARMLVVFREYLLAFAPDIVTLSFTYNDTYLITQLDEPRYLARISAPEYVHDTEAFETGRTEAMRGKEWLRALRAHVDAHGTQSALEAWRALAGTADERTPPERFAAVLNDFATLCRNEGVTLVLVKEPLRDDMPRLWKDEFYAAIDNVAAQFDLTVVDPRSALAAQTGNLFMDDVHMLPPGHYYMAEALVAALTPLLTSR